MHDFLCVRTTKSIKAKALQKFAQTVNVPFQKSLTRRSKLCHISIKVCIN